MTRPTLPANTRRTKIVKIPVNKMELQAIKKRAESANMTVAGFMRWMALATEIPKSFVEKTK